MLDEQYNDCGHRETRINARRKRVQERMAAKREGEGAGENHPLELFWHSVAYSVAKEMIQICRA